ncbi:MOSC domain-containing protein [Jatrophihabitans endophyticus]|uniref:MOSC domain-containing protein n=1 Tax=Jatrophihabitans endophyticus TaxID=1206085 RepID=UPI0019F7CB22|nr:MOSC domain-containing protein [Jatrophihabitans endophyticus]MBE7187956.1 MOSC domain-containing protein [Jatrophihabitans endophyticus]
MPEILQLLVSPVHRYDGRPDPELPEPPDELRESVELRAGLGIVGDRYYNRPAHRDASVTVIAAESLAVWPGAGLAACRRNILLTGLDVDSASPGRVLVLDSGDGPVSLRLTRPARPCAWMDARIAPGAWKALRGHGGMRAVPLTDGVLRVGPLEASWLSG